MSKKFKPVKICSKCQGHDNDCTLCEGTGVALYDEENEDARQMLFPETSDEVESWLDESEEEEDE